MMTQAEIMSAEGWRRFTGMIRRLLTDRRARLTGAEREACEQVAAIDDPRQWPLVDRARQICQNHFTELVLTRKHRRGQSKAAKS